MRASAIIVALMVAACAREPALASYQEQALAVTAAYAPQVDALATRGAALVAREAAVPATVPRPPGFAATLDSDATAIAGLRADVTALSASIAEAIATGERGAVVSALSRQTNAIAANLTKLSDQLAAAEPQVAALEAAAKAMAPPPGDLAAPIVPGAPVAAPPSAPAPAAPRVLQVAPPMHP